jgi:hypothetical protein
MSSEQVHIYSGEHSTYWRPGACGYTTDEAEAGVWTRQEAEERIAGSGPEKKLRLVPVQTLPRVSRETIIVNAHHRLRAKYRHVPLWSFVADICAVGSHSACDICRELGWNPHQGGGIKLTRQTQRTGAGRGDGKDSQPCVDSSSP